MRTFVAFCAVFGLAAAAYDYNGEVWKKELDLNDLAHINLKETFTAWKKDFGKTYATEGEELKRFTQFIENLQYIARSNSGDNMYKLRPNQFTDLTPDEFTEYVHGAKGRCFAGNANAPKWPILNRWKRDNTKVNANPTSVDWTTKGVVTPVKNQGNCGSCWAFSTTGSTECDYAIKTGVLNSLSEQQLMDCSFAEGNLACDGGEMDSAFKYIIKNGGLCSETAYPYKAAKGTCQESSCGTKYNPVKAYTDVTAQNEADLETAAAAGCVSVAIEADQRVFQSYSSGIITSGCGTSLDHGVLVVGYGVQSGTEYWKVKNSWGASWGENGYVLICKECGQNGNQGECGIADDPSFPTF